MDDLNAKASCRDVRRQAIIETARDVFLKEGFAATSMSAVAARVGGSKGTLYNYFSSKESLFNAMIHDHCERGQAEIFDFDMEACDFATALRTLSERYLRLMLSDRVIALNRLVVAEAVRFPEIGHTFYEAGPRRGMKRLAAYISEAADNGHLSALNAELAAEQLMDLCLTGSYRLRLLNVTPEPTDDEVHTRVDVALNAFMKLYGSARAQTAA